jgi:ABC-2 type transport system permease protein
VGATILDQIGTIYHLDDFTLGIIDTNHIVYYVSLTAVFLFLTIRSLESRRWR